jgi:hypothetical protein
MQTPSIQHLMLPSRAAVGEELTSCQRPTQSELGTSAVTSGTVKGCWDCKSKRQLPTQSPVLILCFCICQLLLQDYDVYQAERVATVMP